MIGILTFYWADDYGAMLQAYALKYYLQKASGKKVEIIPYAPVKFTGRYWLCPIVANCIQGKLKYCVIKYRLKRNISYLEAFLQRRKNMRHFRRKFLSRKVALRKSKKVSLKKYSYTFVGSDQVWNPEITVGLDDIYIGNIKKLGKSKLIAYGASFGGNDIPEEYHSKLVESVGNNFASISLRERSAVPFLERLLNRSVTDVLDPTLLLDREEWEKIGVLPQEKDYILFIHTEHNIQMFEYLYQMSVELQKKLIQISVPEPEQRAEWIDVQIEGGPSEFIGYFQNANCVITNSFHGTVFSILFEKQFLVFSHSNKNARLENLLKKLGLKSRLIEHENGATKKDMLNTINWGHVKELLNKEKEKSIRFIYDNLATGEAK